jgi:hypothetical protein
MSLRTVREPLSAYLSNREHASSSQLRRFARHGVLLAGDADWFEGSPLGEALHALVLEPHCFADDYLVLDGSVPLAAHLSEEAAMRRKWLDAWQWNTLRKARDAVFSHHQGHVSRWLEAGTKELSIYWSDEWGGRWKARPDCFTQDVVFDLKTTSDCRPQAFAQTRERLGYDFQAAHYVDAIARLTGRAPRFVYVTVELSPPYAVWLHELSAAQINAVTARLQELKTAFRAQRWSDTVAPALR